ncbi:hypothetical protein EFR25_10050 [Limosilactobacillus fermentum]|nr:hypothetical protein [Limosilactobacillus fermentum]
MQQVRIHQHQALLLQLKVVILVVQQQQRMMILNLFEKLRLLFQTQPMLVLKPRMVKFITMMLKTNGMKIGVINTTLVMTGHELLPQLMISMGLLITLITKGL